MDFFNKKETRILEITQDLEAAFGMLDDDHDAKLTIPQVRDWVHWIKISKRLNSRFKPQLVPMKHDETNLIINKMYTP